MCLSIKMCDLKDMLMQRLESPQEGDKARKEKPWAWCLTAISELLSYRLGCSLLSYDLPPEVFKMASKTHVETWEEIWNTFCRNSSWSNAVYRARGLLPDDEFNAVDQRQREMDGH